MYDLQKILKKWPYKSHISKDFQKFIRSSTAFVFYHHITANDLVIFRQIYVCTVSMLPNKRNTVHTECSLVYCRNSLILSLTLKQLLLLILSFPQKSAVTCVHVCNEYFLPYIVGILLFSLSHVKTVLLLLILSFPTKKSEVYRLIVAKPDYAREAKKKNDNGC